MFNFLDMLISFLSATTGKVKNYINMKLKSLQDFKNHGPPPLISFKIEPVIRKNTGEIQDSFKFRIKTQLIEVNSKTAPLYVPIFNTISIKSLFKLPLLLKK